MAEVADVVRFGAEREPADVGMHPVGADDMSNVRGAREKVTSTPSSVSVSAVMESSKTYSSVRR